MKHLQWLGSTALLLVALVGCGGGTTTPEAVVVPAATPLAQSADGKLALLGAETALPAGLAASSITLVPHTAGEVPAVPAGATFLAAVEGGPSGTVFSSPVTLRFTLASPPAAGANLVLYLLVDDDSNPATPSVWQMTGGGVTVDGNVASVQVTHFSDFGLFDTANVVLPGNGQLRFDTGLGGIPSHLMYNDVDGTLMIPHAALLAVTQSYASITQAPLATYRDSNAGTNGGYFPAATDGAVFIARVSPMGVGEDTYYKMQVVAHTLRPNVGSTDYGALTFKFARILPIDRLAIDGQWSFAGGARLSVFPGGTTFDLVPSETASVIAVNGHYTSFNTLAGSYIPTAGGAGGDLNAVFTLTNGKLNATFTATSGTLGTIALTDGTKIIK